MKKKYVLMGSVCVVFLYYRTLDTIDIKNTILKGNSGSVVRFKNTEDSTSIIDGFTITNGSLPSLEEEGGIYVKNAHPTLKNLIIENNIMKYSNEQGAGGGIYCDSGGITAINLKIRRYMCGGNYGGGCIYASNSKNVLKMCEIANNFTTVQQYCGAIYFKNVSFIIQDSKIENNFYKYLVPMNWKYLVDP